MENRVLLCPSAVKSNNQEGESQVSGKIWSVKEKMTLSYLSEGGGPLSTTHAVTNHSTGK
jgi:hypothetical protein